MGLVSATLWSIDNLCEKMMRLHRNWASAAVQNESRHLMPIKYSTGRAP